MGLYYKHEHSVKRNNHRLLSESHDVKKYILRMKYQFFNVKRNHCALKKVCL
jgi:preprotein translocase subunit Sec63